MNSKKQNQIDCKAGATAKGQNLLANISTSRTSLLQGQYLTQGKKTPTENYVQDVTKILRNIQCAAHLYLFKNYF